MFNKLCAAFQTHYCIDLRVPDGPTRSIHEVSAASRSRRGPSGRGRQVPIGIAGLLGAVHQYFGLAEGE